MKGIRFVMASGTLVLLTLALSGCQASDRQAALVTPVDPHAAADPHAGVKASDIPAGTGHKGKVTDVLAAGEYTYIQVEELGTKVWVAALAVKVAKGDVVEFPDTPPFPRFQSKILNRTFENLYFAQGIRNDGPGN